MDEINPVKAIDALERIQTKLRRLKGKPFDTYRSIMSIKRKEVSKTRIVILHMKALY